MSRRVIEWTFLNGYTKKMVLVLLINKIKYVNIASFY